MNFRPICMLVMGVLLQACATAPTPPTTVAHMASAAPAAPATAVAPAAAPAAAAASVTGSDMSADDHIKMLAKRARDLEYKIQVQNGKRIYCHSEAALGTRFVTKTCLSESGFEDVLQNIDTLQATRDQGACNLPSCQHN